jgi:hypothetical protein
MRVQQRLAAALAATTVEKAMSLPIGSDVNCDAAAAFSLAEQMFTVSVTDGHPRKQTTSIKASCDAAACRGLKRAREPVRAQTVAGPNENAPLTFGLFFYRLIQSQPQSR